MIKIMEAHSELNAPRTGKDKILFLTSTITELRNRMMLKKAANGITTKKIVPFLRKLLKPEKDVEEFVDRSFGVIIQK